MDLRNRAVICLTAVSLLVGVCSAQTTLVAKYNMKGVKGDITFTQTTSDSLINVALSLTGLPTSGSFQLQLHRYRVNYDVSNPCSDSVIGQIMGDPITGISSGFGNLDVSNVDLSGTNSIEGRSFLMTDGSGFSVCSTIEADTDYITAFANLPAYLGGRIFFRQRADNPNADTIIYSDVSYVTSTDSPPTGALEWLITSGTVAMDISADDVVANRCGSSIGSVYNPNGASGTGCNSTDHMSCIIGDLSSKLGDFEVGMSFHNDLNLPLSGQNSIIDKTIAFKKDGSFVACANIIRYSRKQARASFNDDGVSGYILFSQRSPLDVASVEISLTGLQSNAGGYHVHEWPVPWKMTQSKGTCAGTDVAGHFNPFLWDISTSPSAGTGTPDQYEVGDLSGKFGSLAGKTSNTGNFQDTNLQLFGMNNIIGRSVVIHKPDGSRWVCANIDSTEPMTEGEAIFLYPSIGRIVLKQPVGQWYAETMVYVELNTGTSALSTSGHSWHIHVNRTTDDSLAQTGRCLSLAGHYNPYDVDLSGDYSTACSPTNQFRCELGDLSGKHGKLTVRSTSGGMQKAFFTDLQLPLSGPQSVLRRSIVIHGADSSAARLSCADVFERQPITAAVTSWTSADGSTSMTGELTFSQPSSDTVKSLATVDVNLKNLRNQAEGYHVHFYPTTSDCSDDDVGGHFNPFGITSPMPAPDSTTDDKYEVGDLSGKYGLLSGSSFEGTYTDSNLPMQGPNSIIGRSVVVHKADGSRWACGNIEETTPGSRKISARADFSGDISGYVIMTQMRYRSGELGNTRILVDLKYTDSDRETSGHNWHVHVTKISNGDCISAGGHYNPYMVNLNDNYDECDFTNPLRCEMGDQAGKLGQYNIGGGKRFFTDVNLPLEGRHGVVKRSIVFHAQNKGSARVACADLLPNDIPTDAMIDHSFLSATGFENSDMEGIVARALDTMAYNVAVVKHAVPVHPDCTTVTIYFLGPDGAGLANIFRDIVKSGNDATLKPYQSNPFCSSAGGLAASILLLVVCLFLSRGQRH